MSGVIFSDGNSHASELVLGEIAFHSYNSLTIIAVKAAVRTDRSDIAPIDPLFYDRAVLANMAPFESEDLSGAHANGTREMIIAESPEAAFYSRKSCKPVKLQARLSLFDTFSV